MDFLETPAPQAMSHEIADVISNVQGEDFYRAVFSFLGKYVPFSSGHVLKYLDNGAPLVLHDGNPNRYEWLGEYTSGYYLLDPLWPHLRDRGHTDDIYLLNRLAPDSFSQSSYYKEHYRKAQITDEFGWIVPIGEAERIVVCIMKRWDSGRFEQYQLMLARILHPIFSSLVVLHENLKGQAQAGQRQSHTTVVEHESPSACINDFLRATGNEKRALSNRQTNIVDLILQGHSTESIGLNLSISAGTVKTHKRNIYSRLGISSHGELFNLFVTSLKGA